MADKDKTIQQPPWEPPEGSPVPQLKLLNSLTRKKEVFLPQHGKRVLWYSCGPTVYDASHMGHARSYISIDILRRVLQDYFKYDVFYVMNITDVDDKIIKRARQNYLYDEFVAKKGPMDEVVDIAQQAHERFSEKFAKEVDADKRTMLEKMLKRSEQALSVAAVEGESFREQLLLATRDLVADLLDSRHGKHVRENAIFAQLPCYWEQKYHEDMEALNVLPADVLTRVTDYIPEVVEFVQTIISNGYAYESNGSVYFATSKFSAAKGHSYAKLVPEAVGDLKSLEEGEGDLSVSEERLQEKKSQSDFALWKASKPGEPSWDSPWGKGRPGWHIECSVMASSILGRSMDIHTGGFDLRFPHHDNELAQAEAYYENDNWVRYFLHMGHLTIEGCKMSKSLKNFISIQEALERYNARQIRLVFLLHGWSATLDFSEKTMDIAKHYDKMFNEFFLTVKDIVRNQSTSRFEAFSKWNTKELNLNTKFLESKKQIHEALCDNVDTRRTLEVMQELISTCNVYISDARVAKRAANSVLLANIARYMTYMLKIYGAIDGSSEIGYGSKSEVGVDAEEVVMPLLKAFAEFRESVRVEARSRKETSILRLCDDVRDNVLPQLGVRLEDIEGQPPVVKLVDKKELLAEREAKLKLEEAKRLAKEQRKLALQRAQEEKEAQKRIPPTELFRKATDKYSKFDLKGIPTHDAAGEELPKSAQKKLVKAWEAQEKKYKDYLASQNPQGGASSK